MIFESMGEKSQSLSTAIESLKICLQQCPTTTVGLNFDWAAVRRAICGRDVTGSEFVAEFDIGQSKVGSIFGENASKF